MNVVDSSAWLEYFADGANARHFAQAIENLVMGAAREASRRLDDGFRGGGGFAWVDLQLRLQLGDREGELHGVTDGTTIHAHSRTTQSHPSNSSTVLAHSPKFTIR